MKEKKQILFEKEYPEYNCMRIHFDVLDSTQLFCKRNKKFFIKSGKLKENNTIVISCNMQTNGIGTRDTKRNIDRYWLSDEGNLFISFIFLWNKNQMNIINCLAQSCTVAISKTIEYYNLETQIKWINDVLINYKKIAGCLVNLQYLDDINFTDIYTNNVYIICGIGINVELIDDCNLLTKNFTSIKKELINCSYEKKKCSIPSVEQVTEKLLENFFFTINKLCNHGFSSLLDYISIRLLYKEKKVVIDQDNHTIVGYLENLSDDGSIILLEEKTRKLVYINHGHLFSYEQWKKFIK
ncbi:putative biotin protein ligase [Plasmodium gaboni]|uniref:Putative biotin protein ligase n=1 Tax=Plasmodium gaboni TaxID=647221 RepID=A0A151LB60_9APIC|nr:putative biotin protein ligase [Plasmodium gaboni]KYN96191.1 putative biotin protein ligase [Plasmodium gaboni]